MLVQILCPVAKRGKAQSETNKFPVAAGLASTAHDAGNMLEKLPVGTMAGILRVGVLITELFALCEHITSIVVA